MEQPRLSSVFSVAINLTEKDLEAILHCAETYKGDEKKTQVCILEYLKTGTISEEKIKAGI